MTEVFKKVKRGRFSKHVHCKCQMTSILHVHYCLELQACSQTSSILQTLKTCRTKILGNVCIL